MATAPPRAERDPRRHHRLLLAVLAALVGLPVLSSPLIRYDDDYLIAKNPAVLKKDVALAFELEGREEQGNEYLPVTVTSYILDNALWGFRMDQPWGFVGFRLTQLLLYVGCVLLARSLLERLTSDPRLALWGALLFAVHPVHVESVCWLAGRKDLVSGILLLAGLVVALRGRASPGRFAAAAVLCSLAMLAKSTTLVAGPLILLLAGWRWTRGDTPRARWLLALGFVVTGLGVLAAWNALGVARQLGISNQHPFGLAGALATLVIVMARFLEVVLAPVGLRLHYAIPSLRAEWALLADPSYLLCLAACLAAIGATALAVWRRWWPGVLAAAWFCAALVPVMNLIPINHLFAERWLFLPLLGPALAGADLLRRLERRGGAAARRATVAGTAVVATLLTLSVARATEWRSAVTLWEGTLALEPRNPIPLHQLAMALRDTLRTGAGDPAEVWPRVQRLEERAFAIYQAFDAVQGHFGEVCVLGALAAANNGDDTAQAVFIEHGLRFAEETGDAKLEEVLRVLGGS